MNLCFDWMVTCMRHVFYFFILHYSAYHTVSFKEFNLYIFCNKYGCVSNNIEMLTGIHPDILGGGGGGGVANLSNHIFAL